MSLGSSRLRIEPPTILDGRRQARNGYGWIDAEKKLCPASRATDDAPGMGASFLNGFLDNLLARGQVFFAARIGGKEASRHVVASCVSSADTNIAGGRNRDNGRES